MSNSRFSQDDGGTKLDDSFTISWIIEMIVLEFSLSFENQDN